jgi:hypothetical protein
MEAIRLPKISMPVILGKHISAVYREPAGTPAGQWALAEFSRFIVILRNLIKVHPGLIPG